MCAPAHANLSRSIPPPQTDTKRVRTYARHALGAVGADVESHRVVGNRTSAAPIPGGAPIRQPVGRVPFLAPHPKQRGSDGIGGHVCRGAGRRRRCRRRRRRGGRGRRRRRSGRGRGRRWRARRPAVAQGGGPGRWTRQVDRQCQPGDSPCPDTQQPGDVQAARRMLPLMHCGSPWSCIMHAPRCWPPHCSAIVQPTLGWEVGVRGVAGKATAAGRATAAAVEEEGWAVAACEQAADGTACVCVNR